MQDQRLFRLDGKTMTAVAVAIAAAAQGACHLSVPDGTTLLV